MKITKRQLKRIIREEYSRLKRSGMIMENLEEFTPEEQVMVDKEITEFQAAKNRLDKGPRHINADLVNKIKTLSNK